MSARMKAIKQHLAEKRAIRKAAGGTWVRKGECHRCGTCCNIMLAAPEEYEKIQNEAREKGLIPSVANLDPVCENYQSLPSQGGRMGCVLHGSPKYPLGCRRFPANPKQWYRVMETCGYWFKWVEDKPRKAGKERRRKR